MPLAQGAEGSSNVPKRIMEPGNENTIGLAMGARREKRRK
jgi:hypothetical protein